MAKMKVKVTQSPRIKPPNGRVFDDRASYRIGFSMLLSNKKRIQMALGDRDEKLPPLSKRYAIFKSRAGKGNMRNSVFSGDTMANFTLRKATPEGSVSALTARKPRERMWSQQRIVEKLGHSVWGLSAKNITDAFKVAEEQFAGRMRQMVIIKRD